MNGENGTAMSPPAPSGSGNGAPARVRTASSENGTSFDFALNEDELRELAEFTATHGEALNAFARAALGNQAFIRQAYSQGGEFLLRTAEGKFHRVTFL